jgi:acetyl-CoA carboxylase carboxyltransferase component
LYPVDELAGIVSIDLKVPFDPREVLARVVDGSRFEEYKPLYGQSLVTGWASIHGYLVGILANAQGVLFSEEAHKATEFILLCNQTDTPFKDGAKMINAVTNSSVPHITINMGASYGAGNYGMSGRSYAPRFLFTWPNAKTAIMGPEQLAGVMSIVARQSAANAGRPFDEEADAKSRRELEDQVEAESLAMYMSGRVYDDGVIDPRDTRTVLAITLSAVHSNEVRGRRGFGVFRM